MNNYQSPIAKFQLEIKKSCQSCYPVRKKRVCCFYSKNLCVLCVSVAQSVFLFERLFFYEKPGRIRYRTRICPIPAGLWKKSQKNLEKSLQCPAAAHVYFPRLPIKLALPKLLNFALLKQQALSRMDVLLRQCNYQIKK